MAWSVGDSVVAVGRDGRAWGPWTVDWSGSSRCKAGGKTWRQSDGKEVGSPLVIHTATPALEAEATTWDKAQRARKLLARLQNKRATPAQWEAALEPLRDARDALNA